MYRIWKVTHQPVRPNIIKESVGTFEEYEDAVACFEEAVYINSDQKQIRITWEFEPWGTHPDDWGYECDDRDFWAETECPF